MNTIIKRLAEGDPIELVYIFPGSFMMGSPENEKGRDNDETQHEVILTQGYYLQTTQVTQGQWKAVMGNNPSEFNICDENCPVESVSWEDAQEFIKKLNHQEKSLHYRLPTEAEWEYAARADTTTPFSFGDILSTDQANYNGNYPYGNGPKGIYREKTMPVKSFPANAWGLYGMHGNVCEWCQDWYGEYPNNTDPQGPPLVSSRVLRGGSWSNYAKACRSAQRESMTPKVRNFNFGFRLAGVKRGKL